MGNFDDQTPGMIPLSPKEAAANLAALKAQEAMQGPAKAVKTEKKAAESSVTVVPEKRFSKGGTVRGDGCAQRGKTKGRGC